MIDNYYEEYISLSLNMNSENDYLDKNKIRKHNQAMKKLFQLQEKMNKNINLYINVLSDLMNFSDDKVRLLSSSHCLRQGINRDKAIKTLKIIAKTNIDRTISGAAEIILEQNK